MSKNSDMIQVTGVVDEVLPSTMFKVTLENSQQIIAYLGGKLRKNDIKILLGDEVEVEISPYDLTKGRIIYRTK